MLTSSLWQHLQIFSFILNPFESFLRMVCDQNVYLDYIQLGVIGATLFLFIYTILASLLWDIVSGLVWYLPDSNWGHPHLQCGALPTELRYLLWSHLESNQAPTDYESVALTEWAIGPFFNFDSAKVLSIFLISKHFAKFFYLFFNQKKKSDFLRSDFLSIYLMYYINLWHGLTFRWSNPPRQQKMQNQIC